MEVKPIHKDESEEGLPMTMGYLEFACLFSEELGKHIMLRMYQDT